MSSTRPELPREFVAGHKRRRMMDAIAELTAEQGYEATKIADIVRRAAVARKTLYDNFDGKEDLFLSAIDAAMAEMRAAIEEACGEVGGGLAGERSSPAWRRCSTSSPSTRRLRGCAWSRRSRRRRARPVSTTRACATSSSCCAERRSGRGGPAGDDRGVAGRRRRLDPAAADPPRRGRAALPSLLPELSQFVLSPYLGVGEAVDTGRRK